MVWELWATFCQPLKIHLWISGLLGCRDQLWSINGIVTVFYSQEYHQSYSSESFWLQRCHIMQGLARATLLSVWSSEAVVNKAAGALCSSEALQWRGAASLGCHWGGQCYPVTDHFPILHQRNRGRQWWQEMLETQFGLLVDFAYMNSRIGCSWSQANSDG